MGGKWRLLWLALILGMLAGCAAPPEVPMEESKPQPQRTQKIAETLAFPRSAPGSMLILETMQSYSGPYWEDGSGRQVENVAGLMVCNPTKRMVDFAAFAVEQGGETLYFFIHALPPQSRCLALEYTGKSRVGETAEACRELCVQWGRQELSREQLDYLGLGPSMTVINRDGRQIRHVTVRYKQYVADGDYYLGGAVQSEHLFFLEERRTVLPAHYDASHARIVGIELEM